MVIVSNTSLYLAISSATRTNIIDSEKPVLVGRNIVLNNVETL